jgi:hypothetical protein
MMLLPPMLFVAGVSSAVVPTVTGVYDLSLVQYLYDVAATHAVCCRCFFCCWPYCYLRGCVHLSLSMLLLATMLLEVILHLLALLLLASLQHDVAA